MCNWFSLCISIGHGHDAEGVVWLYETQVFWKVSFFWAWHKLSISLGEIRKWASITHNGHYLSACSETITISFPESMFPLTSSGSNHFEMTKEGTEFSPSGSLRSLHLLRTPEWLLPESLVFRPLVKGNEIETIIELERMRTNIRGFCVWFLISFDTSSGAVSRLFITERKRADSEPLEIDFFHLHFLHSVK